MKLESSSPNRTGTESNKKLKKLRSIKLPRMPTSNPSAKWVKTQFDQAPVDSVSDDASSENPIQIEFSIPSPMKETRNSQASFSTSESCFDRTNSPEEKESDQWKPNIVNFPLGKPLGNTRKVLCLKSNRPLKKKNSRIAPFPNFACYVMPQQDGNESDPGSTGSTSSSNEESGKKRETEIQKELKPNSRFGKSRFDHHPSHNYLKATSTSEGKKKHFQASLHDSDITSSKTLKRTPSLRPLRFLMNKSSFKHKRPSVEKCTQVSEVSSVNKSTCSSTLKNAKISLSAEEKESERVSATKVCPYNYCSLHGHHHSSAPPLKRVLSQRRRSIKTQKSMRPRRPQSSLSGKYPNDIMELLETSRAVIFIGKEVDCDLSVQICATPRMEFFGRSTEGNEDDNVAELSGEQDRDFVTGEQEVPEMVDKLEDVRFASVGNSEPNSTTDEVRNSNLRKRNHSNLWHLIHQHMASAVAENQLLEARKEEKQWDETDVNSCQNTSIENNDQEIEIRKTYATKVVREAIEKILLPEVEDQSSDDQSITSISKSTTTNEEEKVEKKKTPIGWSNLKKLILLKRFVKALEKVGKYNPQKPQNLPLEPNPEAEKIHLKPRMIDRKRSSEEWMLDYALQQAVSELAPTQKRKVELLIKAFETMAPPSDEEQIQVPVDGKQDDSGSRGQAMKVDGLSVETDLPPATESQAADGNDKITSSASDNDSFKQLAMEGQVTSGDSGSLELPTKIHKQKFSLIDFCKEDDAESNREKLKVGDLTTAIKSTTSDDRAEAEVENIVISSASDRGPMEELNESIQEFHSVNDSEPDNSSHEACKTELEKEKHVSMWQLIHQHMVEGLSAEGNTKNLHKKNEEHMGDTNILAATENSGLRQDSSSWDQSTRMDYHSTESQEVELRKMFAIKLVREAIEKILLPEVQDQSSDDQSVTSDIVDGKGEEPRISTSTDSARDCTMDSKSNMIKEEVSFSQEGRSLGITNVSEPENEKTALKAQSEKKTPKGWSNLKKLILLKRFVKELEKVRKFNPKKPQLPPLKPGAEAEEVSLRHQTMGERRSADEWMLDYALRKVIGELAPKQKRKVALLVQAFETVAPTSGTPQIQVASPKLKDTNQEWSSESEHDKFVSEIMKANTKVEVPVTSNLDIGGIHSTITDENSNVAKDKDDQEAVHEASVSSSRLELKKDGSESTSRNMKLDDSEPSVEQLIASEEKKTGEPEKDCPTTVASKIQLDKQKHISMWHLLCRHVVSDIATKVESQLPDGEDEEEPVDGPKTIHQRRNGSRQNEDSRSQTIGFSQRDAVKLVREAIEEILSPEVNDDSSDSQSVASDIITEQELPEMNHGNVGESRNETPIDSPKDGREYGKTEEKGEENRLAAENIPTQDEEKTVSLVGNKSQKPKNWSKLKKLMLLKRSIKALEKTRKPILQATQSLPVKLDKEEDKVDLRHQSMEEKKKAEEWMLDYAVQHIVTKLTPARKRRVSMLVEAFEAVVPLPDV